VCPRWCAPWLTWNPEKFIKKLLGENEVEAVLHRLDRLTQDEARTAAAQTLDVVYGLFQNMKVVIEGAAKPSRLVILKPTPFH